MLPINLEPSLLDLLEVGVTRLEERPTWKVRPYIFIVSGCVCVGGGGVARWQKNEKWRNKLVVSSTPRFTTNG